jgi:cytochrome c
MKQYRILLSIAFGAFCAHASAAESGDAVHGKELYQALCSSCHSFPYNGTGPAHEGLFGRKAGGRSDYAYSDALKAANFTWNEATLDAWLADPEKSVPGQKMGGGVPAVQDRADLIAYLKAESARK